MKPAKKTLKSSLVHIKSIHIDDRPITRQGLPGSAEQLKDRILEAALLTLRNIGYQQLTMNGVAHRALVSMSTIHRWWTTKADLVIDAISRRLQQPPPLSGDLAKDLRALILTLVEVFNSHLAHTLPGLAHDLADNPDGAARMATVMGPYYASNAAVLVNAAGRGELPQDIDTTLAFDTLVGTIFYRRLMHRPIDDAVVEQVIASVLTGQPPRIPQKVKV